MTPLGAGTASLAVKAADAEGLSATGTVEVVVSNHANADAGTHAHADRHAVDRPYAYAYAAAGADDHAHTHPYSDSGPPPTVIVVEPTSTFTPVASPEADALGPANPEVAATSERVGVPVWPIALVVAGLLATIVGASAYAYRRLR